MNQIVGDAVVAALAKENSGRVPIDFPNVMNVVVVNEIVLVDVLCAGTIAAQQNAAAAKMFDVVAGDFVLLSMQVHADRTASAVKKMTLFNNAILGPA